MLFVVICVDCRDAECNLLKYLKQYAYGLKRGEDCNIILNRCTTNLVTIKACVVLVKVNGVNNIVNVTTAE
jgi:hypothetical protein